MLVSPPAVTPQPMAALLPAARREDAGCWKTKQTLLNFSSCVPLALVHLHEAAGVPGAPASPGSDRTPGSGGPAPVTVRCHIQQFWKLLPRAFAILQYIIFMKRAF